MPFESTIAWLTFRQLFTRRRMTAAILAALIPAIVAVIYRAVHPEMDPQLVAHFGDQVFRRLVITVLLPLMAVIIGTSAFGAEIDEGTIVYLLVKPIPRWHAVFTKYVVAVLSTILVMIPAIVLPWLVLRGPGVADAVPTAYLAGAALGAVVYGAMFLALGLLTNRGLVVGLLYIILIEMTLSQQIAGLRSISVSAFATAIAQKVGALTLPPEAPPLVELSTVWTMSAIIAAIGLFLAVRRFSRLEITERGI